MCALQLHVEIGQNFLLNIEQSVTCFNFKPFHWNLYYFELCQVHETSISVVKAISDGLNRCSAMEKHWKCFLGSNLYILNRFVVFLVFFLFKFYLATSLSNYFLVHKCILV